MSGKEVLSFQNNGGTLVVGAGSELRFLNGGDFNNTFLDTSAGAGKIDLSLGKFTVNDGAIFSGVNAGDRVLFLDGGTLEIQGSLALDTLHLSGGDLQIDSDSNGASTLTVNTLNWLALKAWCQVRRRQVLSMTGCWSAPGA